MVIRKFIIIILLAPLNGYHVEKYLEAFGGAGGGGRRRPQENLCEDPGITRQSPAKGYKKQKAIKCIYPSSLKEITPVATATGSTSSARCYLLSVVRVNAFYNGLIYTR